MKCCNNCLRQVEEEDYELNKRYVFLCYKSERNLKWFDSFIKDKTQIKFMPLLVEFFLLQLNTIVFEIKVDENDEEGFFEFITISNILIFILIIIGVVFLFFGITYLSGILRMYLNKKLSKDNEQNKKENCRFKCEELSNTILNGTRGIVIFNSFYSLFAFYCLSKDWDNYYIFYIPVLMNKFYFFVFNNHCTVYTDSEERIDYFSSATLLSIYLFIWSLFIDEIKKLPIKILIYAQIALSFIIIFIFILSLLILMFCSACLKNNNNCCLQIIFDKFIKIIDEDEDTKKETKLDNSRKCKGAIKLYYIPPLVGLNKSYSINYINSVLQCLSQTEPLTNYFLKKSIEELIGY